MYEKLIDTLEPKYQNSHTTYFGHAFIVRSSDLKRRIKIILNKSDDPLRPFKLSFINLSGDDDAPEIELKHSTGGYIWIEGTHSVTHDTDADHVFEIRDSQRTPIASFWVTKPGASPALPTATAAGHGTAPATPARPRRRR